MFFNRITKEKEKQLPNDYLCSEFTDQNQSTVVTKFDNPLSKSMNLDVDMIHRFELLANKIRNIPEETSSLFFYQSNEGLLLNKLEKNLEESIFHLQEVCYNPVLDLTESEYKTPISRARKFKPKAINYLASHSEDWQARTFVGVKPLYIKAIHREESWDTYENILTKNLIDELYEYISKRLCKLTDIKSAFDELKYFYTNTENMFNPARKAVIMDLTLHFNDNSNLEDQVGILSETKDVLEYLKRILLQLKNSKLYTKVSNQKLPRQVHYTNLLKNHQHYRFTALLWNDWLEKSGSQKEFSIEEKKKKQIAFLESLFTYTQNLIYNAFTSLGFTQIDDMWEKISTHDNIECIVDETNYELTLTSLRSNESLRIVPITADLSNHTFDYNTNENTMIIYPIINSVINSDNSSTWDRYMHGDDKLFVIPVSTMSVYSQEQVTAVVNRMITISRLNKYPPMKYRITAEITEHVEKKFDTNNYKLDKRTHTLAIYNSIKNEHYPEMLQQSMNLIESMKICPICGTSSQINHDQQNETFMCECYQCQTRWGKDRKSGFVHIPEAYEQSLKHSCRYYY